MGVATLVIDTDRRDWSGRREDMSLETSSNVTFAGAGAALAMTERYGRM